MSRVVPFASFQLSTPAHSENENRADHFGGSSMNETSEATVNSKSTARENMNDSYHAQGNGHSSTTEAPTKVCKYVDVNMTNMFTCSCSK